MPGEHRAELFGHFDRFAVTETPGLTQQLGPERGRTGAQFALGVAAGIGMVAVWGSWAAITRKGALEIDLPILVLIRFLVPAIVFLPVTLRVGLVPANVPVGQLALMVLGSGAFFFLCAAWALALAPVAEVGPLLPATPPLFVALYMAIWHGHKFRRVQIAGLVLITLGVAIIVGWHMWQSHQILAGHFLALFAALLWSIYTVVFRRSGMSALECAAVVSTWSAFVAVPFGLWFLIEQWEAGRHVEIMAQVAMQGVGSGVIAVLLYGISIRTLGAPEAAAMVALEFGRVGGARGAAARRISGTDGDRRHPGDDGGRGADQLARAQSGARERHARCRSRPRPCTGRRWRMWKTR